MLSVTTEKIHQAIEILGTDGITDDAIEAKVGDLAVDQMTARRMVDWIPEAFGVVLLPHIAKLVIPSTFSAKARDGNWMQFDFKVEPIFIKSLPIASTLYHSGPRNVFSNIALRSSMVDVVNRALNAGAEIHGASISGPALIGIPAEVYRGSGQSIWRRLMASLAARLVVNKAAKAAIRERNPI